MRSLAIEVLAIMNVMVLVCYVIDHMLGDRAKT